MISICERNELINILTHQSWPLNSKMLISLKQGSPTSIASPFLVACQWLSPVPFMLSKSYVRCIFDAVLNMMNILFKRSWLNFTYIRSLHKFPQSTSSLCRLCYEEVTCYWKKIGDPCMKTNFPKSLLLLGLVRTQSSMYPMSLQRRKASSTKLGRRKSSFPLAVQTKFLLFSLTLSTRRVHLP